MTINKTLEGLDPNDIPDNEWFTIQSETISVDRDNILIEEFNKEFNMNVDDPTKIYELISLSDDVQDWYIQFNLDYSDDSKVPKYLNDILDTKTFKNVSEKIVKNKKLASDSQERIKKLSDAFKLEVRKENEKLEKLKLGENDPIFQVLNLNIKQLPFKLSLKISNFVPSDGASAASRRMYAKELLIMYKRKLIEYVVNNNVKDVSELTSINKHLK